MDLFTHKSTLSVAKPDAFLQNYPLDLSRCHFQPHCWEMSILQVYETALKPEIYQMYSTEEAQNSPQPWICPEHEQRATLSAEEPKVSTNTHLKREKRSACIMPWGILETAEALGASELQHSTWPGTSHGTPGCSQHWEQGGLHPGTPGHPVPRSCWYSAAKGCGQ